MTIVNTETIPGREIYQVLGLVRGSTVRARNVFRDIGAALKNLVGGELRDYTTMLIQAREEALTRMIQEAERLGANAVVNVRFATSNLMGGAAEIMVYGTAVKVK
ncbi:YbjQ family protein [bacterium]|nr:YbjQ family protein [bacterium]